MNINKRFKELRKTFGLSQEEFGEKIGLSKSGISNIESGTRNVTEKHIKLICGEFPVNESWLRNGIGEPIRQTTVSTMEQLKTEFHLDGFAYSFVYEYLKLANEKRKAVQEFFYNVLNGMDTKEQPKPQAEPVDTEMTVEQAEAEYIKTTSDAARSVEYTSLNTTKITDAQNGKGRASSA